jgi:ribosomal-protein-alanine N-acetyltransferase
LIDNVLREARKNGALAILLEVRESNAAARALYAKVGFREEGRRPRYYRDPDEDAVLMRLRL